MLGQVLEQLRDGGDTGPIQKDLRFPSQNTSDISFED